MRIAKYCKDKGMTLAQFKAFEQEIEATAKRIFDKKIVTAPPGLYFPVDELLAEVPDEQQRLFVIQSLKKLGVEFRDNSTLWRY